MASNHLCYMNNRRTFDKQAVWRAPRCVVFVVINAPNGEGLAAREVLERAMATNFAQSSGGRVQDNIVENLKAAVQMASADHGPEGWTIVGPLATTAAQPNMDPALHQMEFHRKLEILVFCPSPPGPPASETMHAFVPFALLLAIPPTVT